jgi:hypothetical protein
MLKQIFVILFILIIVVSLVNYKINGGNWECYTDENTRKCKDIGDTKRTDIFNIYSDYKTCQADCETLPITDEFVSVIPDNFQKKIQTGGKLHAEFQRFMGDYHLVNNVARYVIESSSWGYKDIITKILDGRSNMYFRPKTTNAITEWNEWNFQIFSTLPTETYNIIGIPISYQQHEQDQASHIITAIADTRNKVFHVIDSNITHTYTTDFEDKLFSKIVTSPESKLYGYQYVHSNSLECPFALQAITEDGTCQSWQVYTLCLFLLNPNIPKKEMIHILSLWSKEQTVRALKEFLFYIHKSMNNIGEKRNPLFGINFDEGVSLRNILLHSKIREPVYEIFGKSSALSRKLHEDIPVFKKFLETGISEGMRNDSSYPDEDWIEYMIVIFQENFKILIVDNLKNVNKLFVSFLMTLKEFIAKLYSVVDKMDNENSKQEMYRSIFDTLDIPRIIEICLENSKPKMALMAVLNDGNRANKIVDILHSFVNIVDQNNCLNILSTIYNMLSDKSNKAQENITEQLGAFDMYLKSLPQSENIRNIITKIESFNKL